MLPRDQITKFRSALLGWFSSRKRDLPWRRARDPYAIWISEIMLQQTRVAAVIPYYERFIARFPDFKSLAEAPDAELLACWSGLGYYHRACNLQKAARQMREAGTFPRDYASIRQLPGVGDYTAAAISSISFNLPYAVVDGNVLRVLSRMGADSTDIASAAGKRHFTDIAQTLLDKTEPGAFNQAVMELGATVCLPKDPHCLVCPVAHWCRACITGTQAAFPIKIVVRNSVRERRMLFWAERDNQVLAWQRPSTSRLMPGFWELPEHKQLPGILPRRMLGSFRHTITFHNYVFELWTADVCDVPNECIWIAQSDLRQLPISTVMKKAARLVNATHGRKATVRSAVASG